MDKFVDTQESASFGNASHLAADSVDDDSYLMEKVHENPAVNDDSHKPSVAVVDDCSNKSNVSGGDYDEEEEGSLGKDEKEMAESMAGNEAVKNFAAMFSSFKVKSVVTEGITLKRKSIKHDNSKFEKIRKAEYGLKTKELREWKAQQLYEYERDEANKQTVAIARVHSFMDAIVMIVRIQSWYRMKKFQHYFLEYRRGNKEIRKKFFIAFKQLVCSRRMRYNILIGKPFWGWKAELEDDKRLKFLVVQFFQMSIRRLRLTPQAVMCFFASSGLGDAITPLDLAKIRRLILKKLFDGWSKAVRLANAINYKASQIIARMMRRTKGAMWSKEGVLVCFHVWHRYAAVKNAGRLGEADPVFHQPILPQWNSLYREVMNQRVHRRKTAETGRQLIIIRMFRMWQHVMTLDRTQAMNPNTKADYHYAASISRKVIAAWFAYLRERGQNVRRRDKCFFAWAAFAPSNRRFRELTGEICIWLVRNRLKKAYNIMKGSCYAVIGKRATALRLIRQNICNRKLLVAAYALAGQNAHVIMLDCWRRWQLWWRARWRWKNANWQLQLLWFQSKARAIIASWRAFVVERLKSRANSPRRRSVSIKGSHRNSIQQFAIGGGAVGDELMASKKQRQEPDNNTTDNEPVTMAEQLFPNIAPAALDLFERAQQNILEARPDNEAFRMFCLAIVRSRAVIEQDRIKMDQSIAEKSLNMDDLIMEEASKEQFELLEEQNKHKRYLAKQLKLQKALDTLDLPNAIRAIEEGAEVQTSHVRQAARHMGDELVSMLGCLLRSGTFYIVERIARRDRKQEMFQCYSPLSGLLLSTHLERWERRDITQRELNTVTYGTAISSSVSSEFQTSIMWRITALMLLKKRADRLQMQCKVLDQGRTVDEEVVQVLLHQRITRLRSNREGLKEVLAMPNMKSGGSFHSGLPALVRGSVMNLQGRGKGSLTDWAKGLDIYALLKEYTTLTGKLTREARTLRVPMLERDEALLRNGFLKQSRADYLVLKRFCMTDAQKQAADAKKSKAAKADRLAALKKARKMAKNASHVSAGLHNSNLLSLLTARDGEAPLSEHSDFLADKVFAQRCNQYKNLIVESWIARSGKKEKDEEICNTYISQRRKEAAGIFARVLKMTHDLCMFGASSKNLFKESKSEGFLPDPNGLSSSGYSGFVWVNALKYYENAVAANSSNGLIITSIAANAPPGVTPETNALLKVFFKWLPPEWWDVSRVHGIIEDEVSGLTITCTGMEQRIHKIDVSNKAKLKEKNSYLSFLKAGRREILGIGSKIKEVLVSDAALHKKNYGQIGKFNRMILKEKKSINELHELISKCELLLKTGRLGDMFRMLEVKFSDGDDKEALNYKAFATIEERKNMIKEHQDKITQFESKKVDVLAGLKSAMELSAQGKSYLSDHAKERFSVIFNVQTLASRLVKQKKELEAEKLSESHSKRILKCYLSVLQDLNTFITDGRVSTKKHKDKKKKVKKIKEDSDDESSEDGSIDSDSSSGFSMAESSQGGSDGESSVEDTRDTGTLENSNYGFALNSDTDTDSSDCDSDAIGFGRGVALDPGYDRKSSLTEGEKIEEAQRKAELARERADLEKVQEARMRVFDEYWLSLGDDGRKNKKPKKFFFEKNQVKGPDIELMPMLRRNKAGAPRPSGRITKIWNAVSVRSLSAKRPRKKGKNMGKEDDPVAMGIAEGRVTDDVNFMATQEYCDMTVEDYDLFWQRPSGNVVPSATAIVPKDPDDEVVVVIPDWFGLDGPRNENYYIEGRKRAALRVAQQEAQQQIGQRSVASFSMDLMDKSSVLSSSCSTLMAQRRKAQKKKHTASNTNGAGKSDSSATVAKNDPIVWAAQEVKPVFVKREERSRVGSRKSSLSSTLSKSHSGEGKPAPSSKYKSSLSAIPASPMGLNSASSGRPSSLSPVNIAVVPEKVEEYNGPDVTLPDPIVEESASVKTVEKSILSCPPALTPPVVMKEQVDQEVVVKEVVDIDTKSIGEEVSVGAISVLSLDKVPREILQEDVSVPDSVHPIHSLPSLTHEPPLVLLDAPPLNSPSFNVSPHSVNSLPLTLPPQIVLDDAIVDEIIEIMDGNKPGEQLPFPIVVPPRVMETPNSTVSHMESGNVHPPQTDESSSLRSTQSQTSNSVNSQNQHPSACISPRQSVNKAVSSDQNSVHDSVVSQVSRKSNVPNIEVTVPIPHPLNPTEQKVNVSKSIVPLSGRSVIDDSVFSQDEDSVDLLANNAAPVIPPAVSVPTPVISHHNKITPNNALSTASAQSRRLRNGLTATLVNGQWMLGTPSAHKLPTDEPHLLELGDKNFQIIGSVLSPGKNVVPGGFIDVDAAVGEVELEGGSQDSVEDLKEEGARPATLLDRLGLSVATADAEDDELSVAEPVISPKSPARVSHPGFLPRSHQVNQDKAKGPTLAETVASQWNEMVLEPEVVIPAEPPVSPPKTTTTIVTDGVSTFGIVAKKTKTIELPLMPEPMDTRLYPEQVASAAEIIERRVASSKKVYVPKVDQSQARRVSSAKNLRQERTASYRDISPIRLSGATNVNRSKSATSRPTPKAGHTKQSRRCVTAGQKLSPLRKENNSQFESSQFETAFDNAHSSAHSQREGLKNHSLFTTETIDFNIGLRNPPELASMASLYEIPIERENMFPFEGPPPSEEMVFASVVNLNQSFVNGKAFFDGSSMPPEQFDDEGIVRQCDPLRKYSLVPEVPKANLYIAPVASLEEEKGSVQRKVIQRKMSAASPVVHPRAQSAKNRPTKATVKPPMAARPLSSMKTRQYSESAIGSNHTSIVDRSSAPAPAPLVNEIGCKSLPVFEKYREAGAMDSSDDDSSVMNLAYGAISRFHRGDNRSDAFGIVGQSVTTSDGTSHGVHGSMDVDHHYKKQPMTLVRGTTAESMYSTADISLYSDLAAPSYHAPSLNPLSPGRRADGDNNAPDSVGLAHPSAPIVVPSKSKSKTLKEFVSGSARHAGLALSHRHLDMEEDSNGSSHHSRGMAVAMPTRTGGDCEDPSLSMSVSKSRILNASLDAGQSYHSHVVSVLPRVHDVSHMSGLVAAADDSDNLSLGTLQATDKDVSKTDQSEKSEKLKVEVIASSYSQGSVPKSTRALQRQQGSSQPPSPDGRYSPQYTWAGIGNTRNHENAMEDELRHMLHPDPNTPLDSMYDDDEEGALELVEENTNGGLYIGNIRSLKQLRHAKRVVHYEPASCAPFSVAMAPERIGSAPLAHRIPIVDQELKLRGAKPGSASLKKKPPVTKAALDRTAAMVATLTSTAGAEQPSVPSSSQSLVGNIIKGGALEENSEHDTVSAMSTDTFHYSLNGGSSVSRSSRIVRPLSSRESIKHSEKGLKLVKGSTSTSITS